jgi:hypothetical protein
VSPENGHEERVRSYYRFLAGQQPEGYDVGDDVLMELAEQAASTGRVKTPWPVVTPLSEVQLMHRVSRSRAHELLKQHATKLDRYYVLDDDSRKRINDGMAPVRVRRALVEQRIAKTGCSRQAAERWARRLFAAMPK